jgi:hypothetical protein
MPFSPAKAQAMLTTLVTSGTPATFYIGLFLVSPTSAGGGVEVVGNGYARVAVANNGTQWTGPSLTSPSVSSNANAINFTTPTADWGSIGFVGVLDALIGGNLISYSPLATAIYVSNGNAPQITASNFQFVLG